jgi:hypothetical protein
MLFRRNYFVARQHACLSPRLISMLRERRDRSILQHPIDVQVDMLVVEAEQIFDLLALRNWRRITPQMSLTSVSPTRPDQ